MDEKEFERQYIISGRVQLVMYRDFSSRKARSLGLVGYVKNKSDGTVFVLAQGTEKQLDLYEKLLKKGSLLSNVLSIEKKDLPINIKYEKFQIAY